MRKFKLVIVTTYNYHYSKEFDSIKSLTQFVRRNKVYFKDFQSFILYNDIYEHFAVFGSSIIPLSVLEMKVQELRSLKFSLINHYHGKS